MSDNVKPLGSDNQYWNAGVEDATMDLKISDNPYNGADAQAWLLGYQWQKQKLKEKYDASSLLIKTKLEAAIELLEGAALLTAHDEYNKDVFDDQDIKQTCNECIKEIRMLIDKDNF
jgi:hypothetical protein